MGGIDRFGVDIVGRQMQYEVGEFVSLFRRQLANGFKSFIENIGRRDNS